MPASQKLGRATALQTLVAVGTRVRVPRQCVLEHLGVNTGLAINLICYTNLAT